VDLNAEQALKARHPAKFEGTDGAWPVVAAVIKQI
jgi:hypothetical protein